MTRTFRPFSSARKPRAGCGFFGLRRSSIHKRGKFMLILLLKPRIKLDPSEGHRFAEGTSDGTAPPLARATLLGLFRTVAASPQPPRP
jgi:hypothetical protein